MIILDGKTVSEKILATLKEEVSNFFVLHSRKPKLAIILSGNDPSSLTYVNAKKKTCEKIGILCDLHRFEHISNSILEDHLHKLNNDHTIDGIIVQLPLHGVVSTQAILDMVAPNKDVDGFNSQNYGRMARMSNEFYHISATPQGILWLLQHYKIDLAGKHCVIIGRGLTAGAPLSVLLSSNRPGCNATVTLCHSLTNELIKYTKQADVIISAVGKRNSISEEMIKDGAIVVDVGISRVPDIHKKCGYSISGDVDFEKVSSKCSYISPVPGGVGPMTIASLLKNVIEAAKINVKVNS